MEITESQVIESLTFTCIGCEIEKKEIQKSNDYMTCQDCFIIERTCDDCDNKDDTTTYINDERLCDSCLFQKYFSCDECGEIVNDDYSNEVGDLYVCNECFGDDYFNCNSCEENFHNDYYAENSLCEDCYRDDMTYCDNCGNDYASEIYGECPNCQVEGFYNYSYKPEPIFYGTNPNNLYFGMELELTPKNVDRDELIEYTYSLFGKELIYIKRDASVSTGFEIVTHPISATEFTNIFNPDNLGLIAKKGGRSWDSSSSCGIHIHLSKKAFTKLHLFNFTKLILDNENFFTSFAGRTSSYANFNNKEYGDSLAITYAHGEKNNNRYCAVNNQNDDTVELRMFKGSLNPLRVRRIIEMVNSIYDYTKTVTVKNVIDKELTTDLLIDFINNNKTLYPNLISHELIIGKEVN